MTHTARRSRLGPLLLLALTYGGASTGVAQIPDEVIGVYGVAAVVAARQDSLLEVALNSPDPHTRIVAILGIASPGSVWYFIRGAETGPAPIHYLGTVARLARIYRVGSPSDRETITRSLARQAERAAAVSLLGEIARSHDVGNDRPLAPAAVGALSSMGADGAAELRALHAAVGDSRPLIRRQLEELSRTGYRRPPGGTLDKNAQLEATVDTLCTSAGRSLGAEATSQAYNMALATLRSCQEVVPEALARAWASPPGDPAALAGLAGVSGDIRDRRVHAALRRVLEDAGGEPRVRLAALAAVLVHADRCLAFHLREPPDTLKRAQSYLWLTWGSTRVPGREGVEPLPQAIRGEVLALLAKLVATEPDEPVGIVAAYGARELLRAGQPGRC